MREEEKQSLKSKESKAQKYLRKRWIFPAIYIASAAVILTGVLWYQGMGNNDQNLSGGDELGQNTSEESTETNYTIDNEAVEVAANKEVFKMPVHEDEGVFIQMQYYDQSASEEDQEAALVFYNNTYYPNTGVDYAMESGKSFDVIASLSGTVVEADQDTLIGNYVKVKHENGVTTHYSSLDDVFVEVGQTIDQGTIIGTAGTNAYNKDAGIHVHYEIRKDGDPINPIDFLDKPLASILEFEDNQKVDGQGEENEDKQTNAAEEEQPAEEDGQTEEDASENGAADEESNSLEKDDVSYNMTRA